MDSPYRAYQKARLREVRSSEIYKALKAIPHESGVMIAQLLVDKKITEAQALAKARNMLNA